jgi:hypothetical protein
MSPVKPANPDSTYRLSHSLGGAVHDRTIGGCWCCAPDLDPVRRYCGCGHRDLRARCRCPQDQVHHPRAADQPPAPLEVRQALKVLDHALTNYIDHARIAA